VIGAIALGALLAYLLGSVPFALLIGRIFYRVDIRTLGSGNVGATNVVRSLGKVPGIACFVLDFGKGWLPCFIALRLGWPQWAVIALGVLAIVGHSRSIFLKFTGGKSVATGVGVIMALAPLVGLAAFGVWALVFFASRYVSLGSILAALSVPVWMLLTHQPPAILAFGTATAVYVIVRHRSNIQRLLKGTEPRMGAKQT
jgi:glycerol-3-phosphate acyltransferase PlsY